MVNRVQTLRSSTPGARPTGRSPGELFTNWPDNALGVVNAAGSAVDLLAVRIFSTLANYAIGDHVLQGGNLYRAKAASAPGAFNAANWDQVTNAGSSGYAMLAASNTFTGGTQTIAPASGAPTLTLNKAASGQVNGLYGQTAGKNRWLVSPGSIAAESGSNAGSDFVVQRFDDAGTLIDVPFSIVRSTGVTNIASIQEAGVALASKYQGLDADLTAIAALATQSFGRSLLTGASASAVLGLLGLGNVIADINLQWFAGAGAFTLTPKTAGKLLYALVFLTGGGAGGGGCAVSTGNSTGAGGGGGGATCIALLTAAQVGAGLTGTIGAGGSGGGPGNAPGTQGGNSSLGGGSFMLAVGGAPGSGAATGSLGAGGAGGSAGSCISPNSGVRLYGGYGSWGNYSASVTTPSAPAGGGGSSFFGAGGPFIHSASGASGYGGGGTGAQGRNNGSSVAGGDGVNGCCLSIEFYTA